jgi:Glucose dehydrogenase
MAKWVYQMTPHDEWDYDGVNEMILADQQIGGATRKTLVHFDRNGWPTRSTATTAKLLVAAKYDPKVNWTSGVDMNKNSPTYGRPKVIDQYSTEHNGEDKNSKNICPAALGTKDEQPAAYSPDTGLFYVPTNHVCMDYEPFRVSYTAGQPYVGATLAMYPPQGETHMGNFIAWDARTGKIVWSLKEQFSVWSGARDAGGVVFYGTLEGYLKAVDAKTGKELYKFKTPSGIIGNVTTYEKAASSTLRSSPASAAGPASASRRPDGSDGRLGRCRRLRRPAQLHLARRPAHGVCAARKLIRTIAGQPQRIPRRATAMRAPGGLSGRASTGKPAQEECS